MVQPLLVVNHAYQRTFTRCLGQQAHYGQANQEPVRRRARAQAKCGSQRRALRTGKRLSVVQHRRAQLVRAREGQFHFRLHSGCPHDQAPRGTLGQVVKQHGLAHARLTAHHQCPALADPHVSNEPIKYATFAQPAD
jgi:hypothetical protein